MQIKLKITIRQLPRSYSIPLGQTHIFRSEFPPYISKRIYFFHSVEFMFLLHRTQGGGELCNALGRDGHMLFFRKFSSHHEDVIPSDRLLH